MAFAAWRTLPWLLSWFVIIPIIALALALAFYKPNNRPFVDMMESAVKYTLGKKLYLWRHGAKKKINQAPDESQTKAALDVPRLSQSKLKDIAWELDIQESIYSEETKPR